MCSNRLVRFIDFLRDGTDYMTVSSPQNILDDGPDPYFCTVEYFMAKSLRLI